LVYLSSLKAPLPLAPVGGTNLGENNLCPDTEQGNKLSFQNQFTLPTTEADR